MTSRPRCAPFFRIVFWSALLALGFPVFGQTYPGKVGVSLEGLGEGSRSRPFVDAVVTSRPWSQLNGQGLAPVDAHGWPTSDALLVLFDIRPAFTWAPPIDDPDAFQPDFSGTYSMRFQGQADVSFQDPGIQLKNLAYDPAQNLTTAQIVVPKGAGLLVISFKNTKRTSSSPAGSGITQLRVLRPGYAPGTKAVFTDEFLNSLKPFGVLRFMDWLETNNNPGFYGDTGHHALNWSDRHTPDDATQVSTDTRHGVAWEYVIQLARQTGKDVWINIPVAATDDYIRHVAQLLKDGLPSSCHVYIEHSNEVWNFGFPQYIYNKMAAMDEVSHHPGSTLANDGCKDPEIWAHRLHARRLVEIGNIFRDVFGPDNAARIRPIYASWVIFPQPYYADVLGWVNKTYGPPSKFFYGMAGASYFNIDGASPTASVDDLLKALRANSDKMTKTLGDLQAIADHYGLKFCQYECGPDTGGGKTENVANRIRASRDPRMKDLLLHDARDNWFAHGGDLYMYYDECSPYSRYGCWGLSEDISNLQTPKWQAIRELTGSELTGTSP